MTIDRKELRRLCDENAAGLADGARLHLLVDDEVIQRLVAPVPTLLDELDRLDAIMVRPDWQADVWRQAESEEVARLKARIAVSERQVERFVGILAASETPDTVVATYDALRAACARIQQQAIEFGETRLVIEQQDRDLARLRAALTEAIGWISDRSSDESVLVERLRAALT